MRYDTGELERLRADLGALIPASAEESKRVVTRGAFNIKKDWKDNAQRTSTPHARLYPRSISYDVSAIGSGVGWEAEIGPRKDRPQGPLGNLLEFGSINNPPHLDGAHALEAEADRFERAVGDLGEQLLGRLT